MAVSMEIQQTDRFSRAFREMLTDILLEMPFGDIVLGCSLDSKL